MIFDGGEFTNVSTGDKAVAFIADKHHAFGQVMIDFIQRLIEFD